MLGQKGDFKALNPAKITSLKIETNPKGIIMDDELQLLQEKLRVVSMRLSNFVMTKQNAEVLCAEYRQLLGALQKFSCAK